MASSADFASRRIRREDGAHAEHRGARRPLSSDRLRPCLRAVVTVYDPDLDPEGPAGALLTDVVVTALGYAWRSTYS